MIGGKYHGISIYDNTTGSWVYAQPMIMSSGTWKKVDIYVYNTNAWRLIGEACTPVVPFMAKGDLFCVGTSHVQFDVPQFIGRARAKDKNGNYLKDIDGNNIYIDGKGSNNNG